MGWGLQDMCDTLTAERDAALARVAVMEEALRPFAFLEMEKDIGLADTEYVWETIFRDRVTDWFSFNDIDAARKALESIHDA